MGLCLYCVLIYFSKIIIILIRDRMSNEELKEEVDEYLNSVTDCLTEHTFMQDYHNVYGIDVDLDSIAQISPDMYPLPLSAT